jgi:predicted DNA-binding protein
MELKVIAVRIPAQVKDKLESLAEREMRPLSNYIRKVLTEHVNKVEKDK